MKKIILGLSGLWAGFAALLCGAQPGLSAVSVENCAIMKGAKRPFVLAVSKGESIREAITTCANKAELPSASVSAIGALENPTIAYYNLETGEYENKTFKGIYELVSLLGNITFNEDKRFLHAHVALGDDAHHMIGGHLVDALVGVVAEVVITPLPHRIDRAYNKNVRLSTILGR